MEAPIEESRITDKTTVPTAANEPKLGSIMWAILIVAALAEISYGMVNFSATPVYVVSLGLDKSFIGIISMSYLLCESALKAPFGVLGDRMGRKRLLVLAPLVSVLTALATVFIDHLHSHWQVPALICLRALDGVALAALWPSAFGIISDYSVAGQRAKAMSLFNISYMAGIACAPALGGAINDGATNLLNLQGLHQKQPSFYACAVLFAITSLVAYRILPEGKPVTNEISPESTEELSLEGGFNLIEFRKMLSQMPSVLWLAFTIFMGVGLIMSYAKPIICQHFAISEWEYGSMMLLPAFIVGTVSFPLGTLGDKIGKVKAIRIGLGLATLGFWLALAFPSLHMILGFGVVIGIGYVIAYPSVFAYVSETCDSNQRGAAIGAVGTAQGLGAIIGNPISSLLVKQGAFKMFGIFPIPEGGLIFLACGIMLMVSFLISLFGLKTKQVPLTSL